jgi:Dolichyl-phosphate-mannose-protein mannosyltransferase
MAIACRPALTFVDSWAYIDAAYSKFPFAIFPERPSGYPFLLHLLELPGRSLIAITSVEHLAGLATGVLVYALLLRLGIQHGVAALEAALVLLDGYAITLEQQILSEAFLTLCLTASVYLLVGKGRGPPSLAASGALLAVAATIRPSGLLAIRPGRVSGVGPPAPRPACVGCRRPCSAACRLCGLPRSADRRLRPYPPRWVVPPWTGRSNRRLPRRRHPGRRRLAVRAVRSKAAHRPGLVRVERAIPGPKGSRRSSGETTGNTR